MVPLDALAANVRLDMSPDNLTFATITDAHIALSTNAEWSHFDNIKSFCDYNLIDSLFFMGDIISGISPLKASAITFFNNITAKFDELTIPVMFASGNHDDNSYSTSSNSEDSIISMADWYTTTRQPFESTTNVVYDAENPNGRYFYKDFTQQKIRVIVLDTTDYPVIIEDGLYTYYGADDGTSWGIGNQQMNWLASTALNFSDKGTDSLNWGVVYIAHMPTRASLSWSNIGLNNGAILENLIIAFNAGTTYSTTTVGDWGITLSADFTSQGVMETIAYFHGHTHADNVQNPIDLGWYYVSTACTVASVISDGLPDGAVAPTPRTLGTDNEDCWDVVTINRTTRVISIRRYGAGSDRTISY